MLTSAILGMMVRMINTVQNKGSIYTSYTTFTTEAKLSSKIMMSELSLATSVPEMPMERPISA